MKNNIELRSLVAILFCCALWSGCATDNDLSELNTGEGFLQVYITHAGNSTRAGKASDNGTKEESTISSIDIYLSDSKGSVSKVDETILLRETSEGYISAPVLVPAGDYKLYVVANPVHSDETHFAPSVTSLEAFRGKHSLHKEKPGLFMEDHHMVMSNWNNTSDADGGGIPVSVTQSNTADTPIKVNVTLDRLAVKIVPEVSKNFVSTIHVSLISDNGSYVVNSATVEAVGLLNAVSDFNLIQQWGNREGALSILTPSSDKNTYSLDRYYSAINAYIEGGTIKNEAPFVPLNREGPESGNKRTPSAIYCMENNSPLHEENNKTKYKGRTTAVIFKARSVVKGDQGVLADHTYYKYNTLYFATLEDLMVNNPELGLTGQESSAELRNKGVNVYENGYMYYTHWIKDNNRPEYIYSVVRNTQYTLTVAKLSGIGDDVPGGGDYNSEDPIDVDVQEIATTAVNTWSAYQAEHIFD